MLNEYHVRNLQDQQYVKKHTNIYFYKDTQSLIKSHICVNITQYRHHIWIIAATLQTNKLASMSPSTNETNTWSNNYSNKTCSSIQHPDKTALFLLQQNNINDPLTSITQ